MKKTYEIDYCCMTTVGLMRKNNEDNFYCDGNIRLNVDSVDDEIYTGSLSSDKNEMLAVFDGMGGEACGEVASLVAAQNSMVYCCDKSADSEYLYDLSEALNRNILEETKARSLVLMGTTSAMIQFSPNEIYISNAGDSKIFRITNHNISCISHDHIAQGYGRKAPLVKFLGMPSERLDAYIARGSYNAGDIYVLCTDGVSDMIPGDSLRDMLDSDKPLTEAVKAVIDEVKLRGAVDNATIIVCKIKD